MEIKKDCFAYDCLKNDCKALKELYCAKEQCKFYKDNKKICWTNIEKELKQYR